MDMLRKFDNDICCLRNNNLDTNEYLTYVEGIYFGDLHLEYLKLSLLIHHVNGIIIKLNQLKLSYY